MHDKTSRELQLHLAARAGDTAAKRELETKDLVTQAHNQTSALRHKAIAGDSASMAALRRMANGSQTTARPVAVAAPSSSQPSASAVRAEERQRISTVFASDASEGRERVCASLLSAREGWSAREIVAMLPSLSTDEQLAQKANNDRIEKASEVWDRARKGAA